MPTNVSPSPPSRPAPVLVGLDGAAKLVLAACLLHALARPDLAQYREKAMAYRWVLAAVVVGFGSVTHVLGEIAEYLSFVQQNQDESPIAYRDTVGVPALSLLGSVVGSMLVVTSARRSPAGSPSAPVRSAVAS